MSNTGSRESQRNYGEEKWEEDTEEVQICRPEHISLVPVEHGVKCESIGPAGGEVEHVDLAVGPGGLPHPAQQDLLAVRLLQV